ncbi:hypothetical protein EV182_003585 [Spiromyces aspiralis]|uniref:Uncharacterized protein n=1 Tax=Spiromyces aspiralis TaxID=68401 RepID=A0ACC1HQV3_9FUNG|nr:hypothetical protein EV182_003585 [Spiromyces aspiralis]
MPELSSYVGTKVLIITNDGRVIVGTLSGFDYSTNVIVEKCQERIFSTDEPVEVVELGLYLIRGDDISVIGRIDGEKDAALDLEKLRGHSIKCIKS